MTWLLWIKDILLRAIDVMDPVNDLCLEERCKRHNMEMSSAVHSTQIRDLRAGKKMSEIEVSDSGKIRCNVNHTRAYTDAQSNSHFTRVQWKTVALWVQCKVACCKRSIKGTAERRSVFVILTLQMEVILADFPWHLQAWQEPTAYDRNRWFNRRHSWKHLQIEIE